MPLEIHSEVEGEHLGEAASSRGRLIAVMTVVTTLAAASAGYLEADAVKTHDEAAVRAERLAALSTNVAATNEDQAQVQIDRYRTWLDARMHADAAQSGAGRAAQLEALRWGVLANVIADDTASIARRQEIEVHCDPGTARCLATGLAPLCKPKPDGTGCWTNASNAISVNNYRERAKFESYRLLAEKEAANQKADAAEIRFAHLAAAVIMLGVAVFLFGFSLTPQGRVRRGLFTLVATGFLLFGVMWTIIHGIPRDRRVSNAAAVAFAHGKVALNSEDYTTAVRQLSQAVKLAPHSVEAYEDLARAQFALADTSGTGTRAGVKQLETIAKEDQMALDNGSESPVVLSDLSATLLLLGIRTSDDGKIRRARDIAQESVDRFVQQQARDGHPGNFLVTSSFTVAEANLALHDPATKPTYCQAIRRMVSVGQDAEGGMSDIDAAAHMDVDMIRRARPQASADGSAVLRQVDTAAKTATAPRCPGTS